MTVHVEFGSFRPAAPAGSTLNRPSQMLVHVAAAAVPNHSLNFVHQIGLFRLAGAVEFEYDSPFVLARRQHPLRPAGAAEFIIKIGPAFGVVLIIATQRPLRGAQAEVLFSGYRS